MIRASLRRIADAYLDLFSHQPRFAEWPHCDKCANWMRDGKAATDG